MKLLAIDPKSAAPENFSEAMAFPKYCVVGSVEAGIEKLFQQEFDVIFMGGITRLEQKKLKQIITRTQSKVMLLEGNPAFRDQIIEEAVRHWDAAASSVTSMSIFDGLGSSLEINNLKNLQ